MIYRKCKKTRVNRIFRLRLGRQLGQISKNLVSIKLKNSSGAIIWATKLQKCVSTSTAEAELNVVVETSKEAVHLANVLHELD